MYPRVNCTALHTFMACSFLKHHRIRVETVMLEQEEGEPEPAGDDASFETQGRHLSILLSYILDQ